ncbi:MAG: hypothetical protein LBJ90_08975, partial [Treponema sp.]|nr:hypothetical protein [Treponema sp.]
DLRTHPLLDAFGRLLEAAETAAAPPDFGITKPQAFSPAEKVRAGMIELCRAWAAFTEIFVRYAEAPEKFPAGNDSFYGIIAFLTLTGDNSFTRAVEHPAKCPTAETEAVLPPVLKAAAASDLDRLGSIAAFDISGLGFYLAGFLRDKGFEKAARHIETEARAFWANEGAAGAGYGGNEDKAGIRLFPKNGDWSEALPAFAVYVRGHGAGKP